WTDVWICPYPTGHIQATGRDVKRRKQYIYHDRWREVRDAAKFAHMASFGAALPRIRRRVKRDLALPGIPRDRVLATIVRLLETTLIRVGNEEYARDNGSFGLTTLRNHHAEVHGANIRFRFRAKSGKQREVDVTDPRLARLVKRCQELPGQELFQYVDEAGELRPINSSDVNDYLREISGENFTAKDFRTWAATLFAAEALAVEDVAKSAAMAQRIVARVIQSVAARLGNTASVCRKSYIHPAVVEDYLNRIKEGGEIAGRSPSAIGSSKKGQVDRLARALNRSIRAGNGDGVSRVGESLQDSRRTRLPIASRRGAATRGAANGRTNGTPVVRPHGLRAAEASLLAFLRQHSSRLGTVR
ncbi:MAG TPA: hypothetical protein VKB78_13695, partial [Pirellulales bacterium]|nr:hypothetical protein [Pirellulales bacterium]